MPLTEIHARLANTALLYSIIMAGWGLWRYFRRQGVHGNYRGALVTIEIVIVVQTGLGAYLYTSGTGQLDGQFMHMLYGVIGAMMLPTAYLFTRASEERRSMLIYALAFVFLFGILFRVLSTA